MLHSFGKMDPENIDVYLCSRRNFVAMCSRIRDILEVILPPPVAGKHRKKTLLGEGLNGYFSLNFFSVKLSSKICLFTYTDSAMISVEYGHIYACRKFVSLIFLSWISVVYVIKSGERVSATQVY